MGFNTKSSNCHKILIVKLLDFQSKSNLERVRLFNRFRIESVLKIAPYHTLKFGCIGKLQYLCTVVRRKAALDKAHPTKLTINILLTL